jgi:Sulfotransferase family
MLISIKYQFIFIHIHKTAGTSIESALQKYLSPFEITLSRSRQEHIKAKELKENLEKFWQGLHLTQQSFDNYFKFAIVRNPWDHQVSLYYHILRDPTHFQHNTVKNLGNFERYIEWLVKESCQPLQKDFLDDLNGNIIVNFIGRFENINYDFQEICQKLNLQAQLPHLNKNINSRNKFCNYYNSKTQQMVYEYFQQDIDFFNYSFFDIPKR